VPAPATQRLLQLEVHEDSKLLPVPVVCASLGVDYDTVLARIESGVIRWAFDIGLGAKIRAIRVVRECLAGGRQFGSLDQVVEWAVPHPHHTVHGEVARRWWCCTRPHIKALYDAGEITGHKTDHTRHLEVASLRAFLKRRRIF
jgi:hypothetical protein